MREEKNSCGLCHLSPLYDIRHTVNDIRHAYIGFYTLQVDSDGALIHDAMRNRSQIIDSRNASLRRKGTNPDTRNETRRSCQHPRNLTDGNKQVHQQCERTGIQNWSNRETTEDAEWHRFRSCNRKNLGTTADDEVLPSLQNRKTKRAYVHTLQTLRSIN